MSDALKRAVRAALLRLLEPLVRLMLDAGVGVGEFVTLLKVAYVKAAAQESRAVTGRVRPNMSRRTCPSFV